MDLLLLRHGIAEDREFDDAGRRLTAEGRQKAETAGRGLDQLDVAISEVWSSPLPRARETAAAVRPGQPIEIVPELAGGSQHALLARLRTLPDTASPLLVGHEPQLSNLAAVLLGARPGVLQLRKAGLIWITVRLATWPMPPATLLCLLQPAQLRALAH